MADSTQPPPSPADPAAQAPPAGPDLPSMFQAAQAHGITLGKDLEGTLAEVNRRRVDADRRSRLIGMFQGPDVGLRTRDALMKEAEQPLSDFADRTKVFDAAIHRATEEGKLQMSDVERQTLAPLYRNDSPETTSRQDAAIKLGVDPKVARGMNGASLDLFINKTSPQAAEAYQKLAAGAASQALAGKTKVEADLAPGIAASKSAEEYALAEKARAEAGVERQKIGSEPAPGYERAGPYNEKNDAELQNRDADNRTLNEQMGRIQEVLGDRKIVTTLQDPAGAAKIQSMLKQHAFDLKKQLGVRLNPSTEKMIDDLVGDPTKLNTGNLLGQARIRLQTNLDSQNQEHRDWVKSHQFNIKAGHPIHGGNAPVKMRTPKGKLVDVPASEVANAPKGWTRK